MALLRKPETAADLPSRDRGKGRTTPLLRVLSDGVKPPQVKGKKIVVYKYKSKKNYRRKQGHRQPYTKVEITKIG